MMLIEKPKWNTKPVYFSYSTISCGIPTHPELHPMTNVSHIHVFFPFDSFPHEKLMPGHEILSGCFFKMKFLYLDDCEALITHLFHKETTILTYFQRIKEQIDLFCCLLIEA